MASTLDKNQVVDRLLAQIAPQLNHKSDFYTRNIQPFVGTNIQMDLGDDNTQHLGPLIKFITNKNSQLDQLYRQYSNSKLQLQYLPAVELPNKEKITGMAFLKAMDHFDYSVGQASWALKKLINVELAYYCLGLTINEMQKKQLQVFIKRQLVPPSRLEKAWQNFHKMVLNAFDKKEIDKYFDKTRLGNFIKKFGDKIITGNTVACDYRLSFKQQALLRVNQNLNFPLIAGSLVFYAIYFGYSVLQKLTSAFLFLPWLKVKTKNSASRDFILKISALKEKAFLGACGVAIFLVDPLMVGLFFLSATVTYEIFSVPCFVIGTVGNAIKQLCQNDPNKAKLGDERIKLLVDRFVRAQIKWYQFKGVSFSQIQGKLKVPPLLESVLLGSEKASLIQGVFQSVVAEENRQQRMIQEEPSEPGVVVFSSQFSLTSHPNNEGVSQQMHHSHLPNSGPSWRAN